MREARDLGSAHQAGQGGWPTLKHFNKETGVSGSKYVQKQAGPVCEEMKNPANMEAWVRETAKIVKAEL